MMFAILAFVAVCRAGPVGPLPNVTSADIGLKEGSCALGDVVYLPGDEFPGSDPCEKCKCSNGGVQCEKEQCEPRPGCKALHRPDQCCPTYQCECEQEGRVYSNGEKLVDPADPCRVCYCQGGEVVCRTIACFVRDDCTPRLAPGRCCPEYDNCPVRGVTVLPGVSSLSPHLSTNEEVKNSPAAPAPKENIKQEITIKEITPVSEIPVITDVKIKEILPSTSIDVAEYSSSKSPLIPREATSEKSIKSETETLKIESPTIIEVHPSPAFEESKVDSSKALDDMPPSKISFSTQDSINSEIYPSSGPIIATMGVPSSVPNVMPVATTTKAPVIEEEDSSLFDHNPAFPPLPDDLSVLSNHGDDIVPEPSADSDHIPVHEMMIPSVVPTDSKAEEPLTTIRNHLSDTTETTAIAVETSAEYSTMKLENIESTSPKESPMLNLRSAIPTELLGVPSYAPQDINGELDENITTDEPVILSTILVSEISRKIEEITTDKPVQLTDEQTPTMSFASDFDTTTQKVITTIENGSSTKVEDETTSSIARSNIATEVTSQTELSSLPIETSDQKPHETEIIKDKSASTTDPLITRVSPTGSEVITVSRAISGDNNMFENVETTEFILTAPESSETATDSVELIKISGDNDKTAPIIESPFEDKKSNPLKDLINLVSDVASISDHTESPGIIPVTGSTSISDSEELIPVNSGYKSKNSNVNQNSITEIPIKSKNASVNKQKVVEIEGDDTDNITDSPPPNDKIEPTTRRPIIDNVSDDMPEEKTDKKDIEIITQSYVPTINKRPTKVVMKKSNDKLTSDSPEDPPISVSSEMATEGNAASSETETMAPDVTAFEAETADSSNSTLITSQ